MNKFVQQPPPFSYIHDLGLPSGIKWADRNIWAKSPEDNGKFFAWGEIKGFTLKQLRNKDKYFSWGDYKFGKDSQGDTIFRGLTKYNNKEANGDVDNLTNLELSDDAANIMDVSQRIPTKEEYEELLTNTTQTWETVNGVNGVKFTSKINGNHVFIPASGYWGDGVHNFKNTCGLLWTNTLYISDSKKAYYLYFNKDKVQIYNWYTRRTGQSIRAVQD